MAFRLYHTHEHRAKIEEALTKGLDVHTFVASWKVGLPMDQVTREQRTEAKIANYNYLYQMQGKIGEL